MKNNQLLKHSIDKDKHHFFSSFSTLADYKSQGDQTINYNWLDCRLSHKLPSSPPPSAYKVGGRSTEEGGEGNGGKHDEEPSYKVANGCSLWWMYLNHLSMNVLWCI